ncbi:hypothetical protein SJ05684_b44020 (plasmid) [Sinorhizobium sojae CCBAU 05684]|uniref:Uncharacterized protein n=1 Tax=Sinorhizobium sojae CCBAU 05684 TaxID=716928 RepID=A0A249PI63_9HYPH|nr:hypothetical protein SJ05684_b44020 [Sinorhizobium sojae CCBAU 05684]
MCRNCAENGAWEEAFGALSTIALERLSPADNESGKGQSFRGFPPNPTLVNKRDHVEFRFFMPEPR